MNTSMYCQQQYMIYLLTRKQLQLSNREPCIFQSISQVSQKRATILCSQANKAFSPYALHVISSDTVAQEIKDNKLYTTKLIRKQGRLPKFIKPFLGNAAETWIVEYSVVDPVEQSMDTCTYNLDHTRVLKVEERTRYTTTNSKTTNASYHVLFSSNFGKWGIKDRIENWSYKRFHENVMKSRRGMSFVMESLREKGLSAFQRQMQLQPLVVDTVD